MDAQVTEAFGAASHERTDKRVTSRNNFRDQEWDPARALSSSRFQSSGRAAAFCRCSSRWDAFRTWRLSGEYPGMMLDATPSEGTREPLVGLKGDCDRRRGSHEPALVKCETDVGAVPDCA